MDVFKHKLLQKLLPLYLVFSCCFCRWAYYCLQITPAQHRTPPVSGV